MRKLLSLGAVGAILVLGFVCGPASAGAPMGGGASKLCSGKAASDCSALTFKGKTVTLDAGVVLVGAARLTFADGTTQTTAPVVSSARDPIFAQFAMSACTATPCVVAAGSKNIASIDRGAVGAYGVNFATAYAGLAGQMVIQCAARSNGGTSVERSAVLAAKTTTVMYIDAWEGAAKVDAEISCVVFKDYSAYP